MGSRVGANVAVGFASSKFAVLGPICRCLAGVQTELTQGALASPSNTRRFELTSGYCRDQFPLQRSLMTSF